MNYSEAIRQATKYLLQKKKNFIILGQGVTSPWYVGGTLNGLNKEFSSKIIDTPVSENLITGAGIGASINGLRSLVIHPRMDFMLYAADSIINQAAKWHYVSGGSSNSPVTIRGIINRGGSQGAQHSQSFHSLFANIPGLRVVMPSSPKDAHDLLIASVNSNDPVIYIDDAWLYKVNETFKKNFNLKLKDIEPKIIQKGKDLTIVSSSYFTHLSKNVVKKLKGKVSIELIDLRVINPINYKRIINSVKKTGSLLVIDGGWENCGLANTIIAEVFKKVDIRRIKNSPNSLSLLDTPAPSSHIHEKIYYPSENSIIKAIQNYYKI